MVYPKPSLVVLTVFDSSFFQYTIQYHVTSASSIQVIVLHPFLVEMLGM